MNLGVIKMSETLYNFFLIDTDGKTTEEINDFLNSDNNPSEITDVQPVGNRLLIKRESLLSRQGRIAARASSFSNAAR